MMNFRSDNEAGAHPLIPAAVGRAGVVNLAARGMLVVSVARRLGSEGPLPTYCVARSNRAGPEKGAHWSGPRFFGLTKRGGLVGAGAGR